MLIDGFGRGIPQHVSISDGNQWANNEIHWESLENKMTKDKPTPPTYGHTSVTFDNKTVAVFGGCRGGSYTLDVSDLTLLSFDGLDSSGDGLSLNSISAEWQLPVGSTRATSRGYASVTLRKHVDHQVKELFVFGGIHEGAACDILEIATFTLIPPTSTSDSTSSSNKWDVTWWTPLTTGSAPSRRFGHAAEWINPSSTSDPGRLLVCGGSDGSDLLRNGVDLTDVYVLDWTLKSVGDESSVCGTWSKVRANGSFTNIPASIGTFMGRCCSYGLVGRKLLLFGGSATLSSSLVSLNVDTFEVSALKLLQKPTTHMYGLPVSSCLFGLSTPAPRLSQVMWLFGSTAVVYGGWTLRLGPCGDLWRLDLAPIDATSEVIQQGTDATR